VSQKFHQHEKKFSPAREKFLMLVRNFSQYFEIAEKKVSIVKKPLRILKMEVRKKP